MNIATIVDKYVDTLIKYDSLSENNYEKLELKDKLTKVTRSLLRYFKMPVYQDIFKNLVIAKFVQAILNNKIPRDFDVPDLTYDEREEFDELRTSISVCCVKFILCKFYLIGVVCPELFSELCSLIENKVNEEIKAKQRRDEAVEPPFKKQAIISDVGYLSRALPIEIDVDSQELDFYIDAINELAELINKVQLIGIRFEAIAEGLKYRYYHESVNNYCQQLQDDYDTPLNKNTLKSYFSGSDATISQSDNQVGSAGLDLKLRDVLCIVFSRIKNPYILFLMWEDVDQLLSFLRPNDYQERGKRLDPWTVKNIKYLPCFEETPFFQYDDALEQCLRIEKGNSRATESDIEIAKRFIRSIINKAILTGSSYFLSSIFTEYALSQFGINPNAYIHYAVICGSADIIRLLRDLGASLEFINEDGKTPIYAAVEYENVEAIKALCLLGVSLNEVCYKGCPPLHWAVKMQKTEQILALSEMCADLERLDGDGKTPMMCAIDTDNVVVISLLKKRGARIDHVNEGGVGYLHYAARYGRLSAILVLTKLGIKADVEDKSGKTIVDHALNDDQKEWLKLLLKQNEKTTQHDASSAAYFSIG